MTAEEFPNIEQTLDYYNKGLGDYQRRDWAQASAWFQRAIAVNPRDKVSFMYNERCQYFVTEPPPDTWDGVWVMKDK
jgi:adenylate cyclase